MGVFGTPKYLCAECESEFDLATNSRDPEEIGKAMQAIGDKMAERDSIGKVVYEAVNEIFDSARERAEKIKDGTYDFSLDDSDSAVVEAAEEVPEELRESEEDKEIDKREKEKEKKVGKIMDWITASILALAVGFAVYKIIVTFI